jgi:site-specific DNA-methyltransferase (adenine-specific)
MKLFNDDCLKVLPIISENSVDLIITSPPYNKKGLLGKTKLGNQIWKKFNIDYKTYNDDMSEKEYQLWIIEFLNECYRLIKPNGSIFFNHKPRRYKNKCYLPTDFVSKSNANLYQMIIWDRKNSPNIRNDILIPSTEHIYWLCKDKPKVFRNNVDSKYRSEVWTINPERQKEHPAPFPLQLVNNCIQLSTQENDLVLDPFMGSGTTGLVCKNLNRNFIGIELDQNYFNIAKQRIESTTSKSIIN